MRALSFPLLLVLLAGTAMAATPDRGRVRVANGTIVTDQNTRLRGGAAWVFKWGRQSGSTAYVRDAAYYQRMRAEGINAVRVIFYDPDQRKNGYIAADLWNAQDIADTYADLDRIVNLCAENGMYAMINFHEPGAYVGSAYGAYPNRAYMFRFWELVAARYANRTHVFYELMNEPKWYAEDFTQDVIDDTRQLYTYVKGQAPSTHQVLFSYANTYSWNPNVSIRSTTARLTGIDWSNASVGFHPYTNNYGTAEITDLRNAYPVLNTEMNLPPERGGDGGTQRMNGELFGHQTMERLGVSWFGWQMEGPAKFTSGYVNNIKADALAKGYFWQSDAAPGTTPPPITPPPTTPPPTTPPPTTTLRTPDAPTGVVAGLDYRYYQGAWNTLPDFATLTPAKSGTIATPDLAPRMRDDEFAFRYSGFIEVPADGTWTFTTTSDDGSRLWIGSTLVVDNDGLHGSTERSGSIGLKAGRHAVTVAYFERGSDHTLEVTFAGPGVAKQTVPAARWYRADTTTPPPTTPPPSNPPPTTPPPTTTLRTPDAPAGVVAGLDYRYYQGAWNTLPDFAALTSVKNGTVTIPDLAPRMRDDEFAFRYTGFVEVPADGTWTFTTISDDGSRLWIGSTLVVDNDGLHGWTERSGSIGLKAGRHAVTVAYFERGSDHTLEVTFAGPGVAKQAVPAARWYRAGTTTTPPPAPPTDIVAGLDFAYYHGAWNVLPDFSTLAAVKTGNQATVDLSQRLRNDDFGVRFTGYLTIPTAGTWYLSTVSDDGSRVWIDGTLLVDNDGLHGWQERTASRYLSAGRHTVRVEYFERSGGETMEFRWEGPSVPKQLVPASALSRPSTATAPTGSG